MPMRRPEGALAEGSGHAEGARADRSDGAFATSRSSTPTKRVDRIAPMRDAMEKVVAQLSRRSRDRDVVCGRALPPGAAPRHSRLQRSERQATAPGARERAVANDVHHPGACHLYVHATESTIVPGRAEACAEFLGRSIPARVTSITCRRTPGTRSAGGAIPFAPISRPGIRTRRPRSVKGSPSTRNTTCTCCCMRRLRWPGRHRDARGEGLRQADWRHASRGPDPDAVRPLR